MFVRQGKWLLAVLALSTSFAFTQSQPQSVRRPAVDAQPTAPTRPQSGGEGPYNILTGLPMLLTLHHDTLADTGEPIDIYDFVIEMQVMNSDGNLEPVGLQIHNFYTAKPLDRRNDINPHNARDCKRWNGIILRAIKNRKEKSQTWPYVQFITAVDARVIQTNEHGAVWYSDDVECWGAMDRFPPF